MLWNQSDRLPEVLETGVGLLLIQFEARVDQQLLVKEASAATEITPVQVNGELGLLPIGGATHCVLRRRQWSHRRRPDPTRRQRPRFGWRMGSLPHRIGA